jgi:hypothetical protein
VIFSEAKPPETRENFCRPICLQRHLISWRRKQSSANRPLPVGFPVLRENTGKFADFGLEIAEAPLLSEENSIA